MRCCVCTILLAVAATVVFLADAPARNLARLNPTNIFGINTPKDEDDPHVSPNNLRLYYASNSQGRFQIMMSQRRNARLVWPAGTPVEGIDPDTDNRGPCLTTDDHHLYFATNIVVRDPEKQVKDNANYDLVHSIMLLRPDQFTNPTPVQTACTEVDEAFPWATANGQELYFSRKTKEGWRLFVANRPQGKGAFGEPRLVQELPPGFHHATLSGDGRLMFLEGPVENKRWGLYRSTRPNPRGSWTAPEPLDDLNSPDAPTGDRSPCLSRDGTRLYFSSDRQGTKGGLDLWVINDPRRIRGKAD